MASFYPGLLGMGGPVRVADMFSAVTPLPSPGESPFRHLYTEQGTMPLGSARPLDSIWGEPVQPGRRVGLPAPTTPGGGLLAPSVPAEPWDTQSSESPEDEPAPFDPMGVEGYQISKSPEFQLGKKLMVTFGPPGFGTFMGLTELMAEARAVDLAHERFGLEPVSFMESFQRDFQPDIEYAGLPNAQELAEENARALGLDVVGPTEGRPMTSEEMAAGAHQPGYFETGIAGVEPEYTLPDWLEWVDLPEGAPRYATGDPDRYTVEKNALYDEDQLNYMTGVHQFDPALNPMMTEEEWADLQFTSGLVGSLKGGTGTGISDLGTETGSTPRGRPDTSSLGWDPGKMAFDIYTADFDQAVRDHYTFGTPDPRQDKEFDKFLQTSADEDPAVTGEWDPETDPIEHEVVDPETGQVSTVSTADWNWDYQDRHPTAGDPETNPDYARDLALREASIDRQYAREDAIHAAIGDWDDQDRQQAEREALEQMEQTGPEAEATAAATGSAVDDAGGSRSGGGWDWGDGNGGDDGGDDGGDGDTHICTAAFKAGISSKARFRANRKYGINLRRNDPLLMRGYDKVGPWLAQRIGHTKAGNVLTKLYAKRATGGRLSLGYKILDAVLGATTRPALRLIGRFA